MKRAVLLICILCSIYFSFSQSTFIKSYDMGADDYGNAVSTSGTGIYLVGSTSKAGAGSYDAMLLRLDASGNFVWQTQLGGSEFEAGRALTPFHSGFVITGPTASISTSHKNDAQISLIDTTGVYQGSVIFGFDSTDEVSSDVVALADTGLLIIGTTKANGDGNHTNMFVIRTDANASPLWMRTYGTPSGNTVGYKVFSLPGIGFIAVGSTENAGAGGPEYYAVNFDDSGHIQNQVFFGAPFYDEGRLFAFDGAHILLAGITGSTSGPNRSNAYVTALDPNGLTTVWAKTYGGDTASSIVSLDQDPTDGNLIAGGYKSVLGMGVQSLVFKIDTANGNVIWANAIGSTGDEYLNGGMVLSDGTSLVAGETNETSGGPLSNAFIAKTSPDGTLCGSFSVNLEARDLLDSININNAPDHRDSAVAFPIQQGMLFAVNNYTATINQYCLTTGIRTVSLKNNTIQVYPNPSNGMLTIESSGWNSKTTMIVYNTVGSEVLRIVVDPQMKVFSIDLSGNPKGMYFISFNDGSMTSTEKISIY